MYTWILQVKSLEHCSSSGMLTQVFEIRPGEHGLVTGR